MKKTTKSNPLKFFNDNKSMAYKKAGGQMSTYKVKLKKAQDGIETENDMMINKPGSTGGYKKSTSIFARPEGMNIPPISIPSISPYMIESNVPNANALTQEMINKVSLTPSSGRAANQKYLDEKAILDQDRQRYGTPKNSDGPYKNKKGGTTGSHRMPNGKMMLNSAMKKKTSKNK